ncbi:MAG: SpoIIE family protein phosphatase [Desulfobacterales bacterium]|nr:SpoIIE family protein phosphatase [Desulfobacterales bacterium]
MRRPSDKNPIATFSNPTDDWDKWREGIIGFGERSSRKTYYAELQRQMEELERFKALLDQSHDAIFLIESCSGRITDVNRTACQILGYTKEEMVLMAISEIIDEHVAEAVLKSFSTGEKRITAQSTVITELHAESDNKIPAEISLRFVEFSDKSYIVTVARDITERLGRVKAENEANLLAKEMELAEKIQTALLPKKLKISGYEIAASMHPSDKVGGDYYDLITVGNFDWIVIGDVSGHGVAAGLVMMMVQTAIHTILIQNPEVQPSQLLSVINKTIYENVIKMDEHKHMTILVIACGKDGIFNFSGLHEDILLWRADTGKVEVIETCGMWIGLEPDISKLLQENEFRMETGDCIVLYTDGITEAWNGGDLFGDDRLIKIVESSGGKSVSEIHAAVLDAIEDYEKPDDVTLFVMKRMR